MSWNNTPIFNDETVEKNISLGNLLLKEFNTRLNENHVLEYDNIKQEFIWYNDSQMLNHYFYDYCLQTINWFIGIHHYPHIVNRWIDKDIYVDRMYNEFLGRQLIFGEQEINTFKKIFKDFYPDVYYLSDDQKQKIKEKLNLYCQLANS